MKLRDALCMFALGTVLGAPGWAQNSGAVTKATAERDREFFVAVCESGMVEVQFGKLALDRAYNPDVKALAQELVDQHNVVNERLRPMAASHNANPPQILSKVQQDEYDKMMGLSGMDFDKEFLTVMVAYHGNDLHQYRREAAVTADPALKAVLQEVAQQTFQQNLKVDRVAAANRVAVPGHPMIAAGEEPSN